MIPPRVFLILSVLTVMHYPGPEFRAAAQTFQSGPAQVPLLELYTSEGCSSCPPADEWFSQLKSSPKLWREFVPVAFHVETWDHLGWPDPFASPRWSSRQRAHAARWGARGVYTPGFVLNGTEYRSRRLPRRRRTLAGNLKLEAMDGRVRATFQSSSGRAEAHDLYLAQLGTALESKVAAGENRGRTLTHDFVVLSVQQVRMQADPVDIQLDAGLPHPVRALAGWITRKGSLLPIQATGGWLEPKAAGDGAGPGPDQGRSSKTR